MDVRTARKSRGSGSTSAANVSLHSSSENSIAEVLGAGVGAGLRKGEEELKAKINKAIADIRADGTYDAITAKYFASSIYGD